jgi:hypothetical protein
MKNAGRGAEKREHKLVQPLWEAIWTFLKRDEIFIPER